MTLPLKESTAIRELADVLYDFLPGSGSANWKGHVSFKTVAERIGVGGYWQPGSKLPMVVSLLERTFEYRRSSFERLVVEIVRCGFTYRKRSGTPLTVADLDTINGLILQLGFKFPDLWDPQFRASLAPDAVANAASKAAMQSPVTTTGGVDSERRQTLELLKDRFLQLNQLADRQRAGLDLEALLNGLFELHRLQPRQPFRVTGEQIDGSFELDHEVYLLEAKWQQVKSGVSDLYVFREKIEGKSKFTRGVFLSINGITDDAIDAVTRGKQANFFTMDGFDLFMLLSGDTDLTGFLRRRQRLLAEGGLVRVAFNEAMLNR